MKNFDVIKRLIKYVKPYVIYLIFALISAVVSVALTLFAPVITGNAIDYIVGANDVNFQGIAKILVDLAIIIILGVLFQWILGVVTTTLTQKTVRAIRVSVFAKLNKLPLGCIDRHSQGDMISRVVNDVDQISEGLLQGFTQLFTGVVTIVGTLIFMLTINVKIALIVVLITPLSLFVASFISKHSYDMFREQSTLRGKIGGYVEEMVGNQKVVASFGYEERAQEHFEGINDKLHDCGIKAQFYSSMTNPCTRFINGLVYAVVGITSAVGAINGNLTVGQISCFLAYANQYTKPFNEITGVLTELQSAFASARRIFEVLDESEEIADETLPNLQECDGTVNLSNVCFSYTKEKELIKNLNLSVSNGQRIAIVGPTGCGKTTIINLLMRFYDVDSGEIIVSDKNIKEISRKSLRSMYGMVLQDTWLFSGTVRDNIRYGMEGATEDEVVEVAKQAHIHSFIKRLPNGYDTIITENGTNISQGQRQLLCIARIMLTKPPMLILDEATSSIDTRTEQKIGRAFEKIMQGRTTFIVAHRLSTIRDADVILVMRDGNIIEHGNHEELLKKKGFYANLYNSQFDAG